MAVLAPSLVNLRAEIDARWPGRDRRTDGWIGDAAHQARQSDHNPDNRGIVHAIDIDKDGINPNEVISACIRMDRPTAYVIFNRWIYSRSRDFDPRPYTGTNPHTDHLHVSIQYGTDWEKNTWHWGIAVPGNGSEFIIPSGQAEEMTDFRAYFDRTATEFSSAMTTLAQSNASLINLIQY